MNLENAINLMVADWAETGNEAFEKCDDAEIKRQEKLFFRIFNIEMPETYKKILKITNGIMFNGLTIWPVTGHKYMKESIYEANEDLSPNREFVVLAQIDEELYVYDNALNKYVATEYWSSSNWKEFESSDDMFNFIIERVLVEDEDN